MAGFDGRAYQARFDSLAAAGHDVHGEASFVMGFMPKDVLDAGCGTGRVAIELARRGVDVVGVDVSASMIAEARRLAPDLPWVEADLARMDLGREFDVVVMAGNVPLFCPPEDRALLVMRCGRHVRGGGRLVGGFQLGKEYDLGAYDDACVAAGLQLERRYATWDGEAFSEGGDYAVSVHRKLRRKSSDSDGPAPSGPRQSGQPLPSLCWPPNSCVRAAQTTGSWPGTNR